MWLFQGRELPLDLSELRGRTFVCVDQCQLCCLCQPELLGSEIPFFKKNFPERLTVRRTPHKHTALALKKGGGPCAFLEGGRCSVYPNRPHYCRQFPFHVYLGERAQVELDLSCRGVWMDRGEDATLLGLRLVEENRSTIVRGLQDSSEIYEQFRTNCQDAELELEPQRLRADLEAKMEHLGDPFYLGRMLEMSVEDEEMSLPAAFQVDENSGEELRQAAMETSLESLNSMDPFSSPVYCDPQGRWNIFMSQDGELDRYVMGEEGDLERAQGIDPRKVPLLRPEGEGKKLFLDYLRMLNRRDSMLGHAYYLLDDLGYEDHLPNVYYGSIATAAVDLLWRSSLLAHVAGEGLRYDGVREGIIYYDMDRLDAPTIGAFI